MSPGAALSERHTTPRAVASAGPSTRRRLAVLALATAVGSAGLAAGGTAGGIAVRRMTTTGAWVGVPTGLLVAGSALGALTIARRAGLGGRSSGISTAYVIGALGAAGSVAAIGAGSLVLLLAASVPLGWGNAAVFFTRYEAAGTAEPGGRGRALGLIFGATAVGAVLSPTLLGPGGALAAAIGLPAVAGLYVLAAPCFIAAAAMLAVRRPAGGGPAAPGAGATTGAVAWRTMLRRRSVRRALATLAAASAVMVGIMAIAPVWMEDHGHGLGLVGSAISFHVLGMFGPSPLTGWLADRVGAVTVARAGVLLLLAAAAAGAFVPAADAAPAIGFLLLLGVGWNAGVVGASAMLTAAVPAAHQARAEGAGEVTMGVAAALCGPGAGLVASGGGFAAVCAAAAAVSALAFAASGRTG